MTSKIAALTFFITSTLLTADCTYQTQIPKVSWKAFKTYEKAGVGGTLGVDKFHSTPSKTIDEVMIGNTILINTRSVNTANPSRDATLIESFFNVQKIATISGTIQSVKNSKAYVMITINQVTKLIPIPYTISNDTIIAKGSIDLGDFSMIPSLQAINKACYDLHEGKTWQDVEIGFEMPIKKECR
jgi:hypothetical protein